MSMLDVFNDSDRPWTERRPFEAGDQGAHMGYWPNAQLVIHTLHSTYAFRVEGGAWDTCFTLIHTTNATAQEWVGDRVTLGSGVSGSVQTLVTDVLYGRRSVEELDLLQQLVGRRYSFTVWDWKGAYGSEKEEIDTWLVSSIQSIQLQAA